MHKKKPHMKVKLKDKIDHPAKDKDAAGAEKEAHKSHAHESKHKKK